MALVDREHMTELRSASDAKATALSAESDIQLQSVAYAINEASNTGLTRTIFRGVLLDNTKTQLESKGYKLQNYGEVQPENMTVISWNS